MLIIRHLESLVRDLESLILARVVYVDTFCSWTTRRLEQYEYDTLDSPCGTFHCANKGPMKYHPTWRLKFVCHQPQAEVFELLAGLPRCKVLLSRVDIALDLLTNTRTEAEEVKAILDRHLVMAWHGMQKLSRVKETTYFGGRPARNNIAIYSDRPSKVNGSPCCHTEWRITGAQPVRAAGVDLNHLDPVGMFTRMARRRLKFAALTDHAKLGKIVLRKTRRRGPWMVEYVPGWPFDRFKKVGHIVERAHDSLQEIIDDYSRLRQVSVVQCMDLAPVDVLLPDDQTIEGSFRSVLH
jgi:hypothetical protein